MSTTTTALDQNTNLKEYLNQDRSVNIQKQLAEDKKTKESGLDGIEIRKGPKSLDKNDFLKLLVTQLTHQDPTQPMQDQQFIAQMAQFSALEQMNNVAGSMNRLATRQALHLVGRMVVGTDVNGIPRSGVASALYIDDSGKSFLKVGEHAVPADNVKLIGDAAAFRSQEMPSNATIKRDDETSKSMGEVMQKAGVSETRPTQGPREEPAVTPAPRPVPGYSENLHRAKPSGNSVDSRQ